MFRDQSTDTASKFHVVETKARQTSWEKSASSHAESVEGSSTDPSSSSLQFALAPVPTTVISSSLSISPEDEAACYFFSNYTFYRSNLSKGFMEFLPSLYDSNSPRSPLWQIITSLGMAGLANFRNAPDMKVISTYKYASALREVNAMLRIPARATEDETLISILLLSIYEVSETNHMHSVYH